MAMSQTFQGIEVKRIRPRAKAPLASPRQVVLQGQAVGGRKRFVPAASAQHPRLRGIRADYRRDDVIASLLKYAAHPSKVERHHTRQQGKPHAVLLHSSITSMIRGAQLGRGVGEGVANGGSSFNGQGLRVVCLDLANSYPMCPLIICIPKLQPKVGESVAGTCRILSPFSERVRDPFAVGEEEHIGLIHNKHRKS